MSLLTGDWSAMKNLFSGDSEYDADNSEGTAKLGKDLGALTAIMGGITTAIGSFYAAKSAQNQYKSVASAYQFRSDMAAINARNSEMDAQAILEAGKSDVQRYTMKAGQDAATTKATTAAHGVALGVGSTRDVAASQEVVKDIDMMTINSNATRAAWAARTQGTNFKNQALLDNVSSQNAIASSRSISPMKAGLTSLLSSASTIASQWNYQRATQTVAARGNY